MLVEMKRKEVRTKEGVKCSGVSCNNLGPWEAGAGGLCVAVQLDYIVRPCVFKANKQK